MSFLICTDYIRYFVGSYISRKNKTENPFNLIMPKVYLLSENSKQTRVYYRKVASSKSVYYSILETFINSQKILGYATE